jgi:UDP-glucose:(heptosyl)LPS alpha-1,3-glucosyltransferase
LRAALNLGLEQTTWLWIGTQPDTKGLDRVIKALAKSPDSILLVAGLTPDKAEAWQSRANELRIAARIRWLGYRDDIPDLMVATDLLVHPARLDITGGVILEAVVNGLPVIATEICGFAEHVVAADAGVVLPEPFAQDSLETALRRLGDPVLARQMSDNGVRYGENPQLYAGLEVAAQIVQEVAATR